MDPSALPTMTIPVVSETLLRQQATFNYIQVAFAGIFVWELIITFPTEVLLWRQKGLTVPNALFTVSRWPGFGVVIADLVLNNRPSSVDYCHSQHWILPGLASVFTAIIYPLLLMRVWAIWGKSKAVLAFLVFLWLLQTVISIVVANYYIGIPYAVIPGLGFWVGGCANDPTNNLASATYIMNAAFDTIIFLMTVGKLMVMYRVAKTTTPLQRILKRDGIQYYFVVMLVNLINIALLHAEGIPVLLRPALAGPSGIATVIMTGRLYLNLHQHFGIQKLPDSNNTGGGFLPKLQSGTVPSLPTHHRPSFSGGPDLGSKVFRGARPSTDAVVANLPVQIVRRQQQDLSSSFAAQNESEEHLQSHSHSSSLVGKSAGLPSPPSLNPHSPSFEHHGGVSFEADPMELSTFDRRARTSTSATGGAGIMVHTERQMDIS